MIFIFYLIAWLSLGYVITIINIIMADLLSITSTEGVILLSISILTATLLVCTYGLCETIKNKQNDRGVNE
ncbi:hypothetical protein Nther_1564 [Natranaerobius thermophilus JW/NM-WN-LF]|uniref:Uncharacterized protein n=1 Tax=Natranaerobius thermophilus (strain ATCC BAA-1301 / DSM 18059 / JW/NM-WN-LF) TaxID=457570 RepID=B2A439_NATTJ|nr:hypothetical protein Nther_1564 [Natranaerobius thermophilus JW/NM-WN-LF]